MSVLPRGSTIRRDAGLHGYERGLSRHGLTPVAGVDEAGCGACAGPLVAAAVGLAQGALRHRDVLCINGDMATTELGTWQQSSF